MDVAQTVPNNVPLQKCSPLHDMLVKAELSVQPVHGLKCMPNTAKLWRQHRPLPTSFEFLVSWDYA